MCGLFAWLPPPGVEKDFNRTAREMFAALAERGPDDRGFLTFDAQGRLAGSEHGPAPGPAGPPVLLMGQTRLAIIDLSPAGHQPMMSPDGRYTLIFNGEIYNYLELRRELEAEGLVFHTRTDTEVLLAALAYWGRAALNRLEGMFALALFDALEKTIFCARDIFGIKPLFWSRPGGRKAFALASELPALWRFPRQERRLDWPAAYNYLAGGIADVGEGCLAAGVRQLPPGHWLAADLEGQVEGPAPYFTFALPEPLKITFDEAAEETRRLFLKSVKLHLRADVPLGVALSGGLDSTSVAYAARHIQPAGALKTFSFVAPGHAISEEPWIDLANAGLGAEAHKVSATPDELFRDLPRLIARLGEPFGSTSIYAQYRVFQLAREAGVVVTLDGQGADELLAGYLGYTHLRLLSLLGRGRWLRALKVLKNSSAWPGRSVFGTVKRLGRWVLPPALKNLGRAWDEGGLARSWLNLKAVREKGLVEWPLLSPRVPASPDFLRRGLASQLTWAGLPGLLRHGDRNSMTFSIESRVPFCNRELAAFLLSLPEDYLVTDEGLSKAVFRRAMRGLAPDSILDRRDKIGFETPEREWFLSRPLWVEENLKAASSSKLLNAEGLSGHWRKIKEGRRPFNWLVWRWINYLRWKDIFKVSEE